MKAKAKVYYKDILSGYLLESQEGDYSFQYTPEYLASEYPAISYSLAKQKEAFSSRSLHGFFDGLLPEGWLLKLAGQINKLNPLADRYELLLKTCSDPIGAVSVLSEEDRIVVKKETKASVAINHKKTANNFKKCLYCYEKLEEGFYHKACAKMFMNKDEFPAIDLTEEIIQELEKTNLESHVSIPGVQHKISLELSGKPKNDRLTITNFAGNYILKPKAQVPHVPENEHLVMRLAIIFGIETADSSLALLENGDFAFITKRFDRIKGTEKLHVEDFCQILDQLTLKKYISSVEKVGKALKDYCKSSAPQDQVLRLFELVVFSYVVGNSDLHLKNISVVLSPNPQLAPAYDLLSFEIYQEDFKERDHDESALAINGKKAKLMKEDFDRLAESLGIKDKVRNYVYGRLQKSQKEFDNLIDKSFLPENKRNALKYLINVRSKMFIV